MAYATSPVRVDTFDVASMVANSKIIEGHSLQGFQVLTWGFERHRFPGFQVLTCGGGVPSDVGDRKGYLCA